MSSCKKNQKHVLPEGEDSWLSARCDLLVASALDGCKPCQERLIGRVCFTLTDDFGRLFTSWTMQYMSIAAPRSSTNMLDLVGLRVAQVISAPSRKALRSVRIVVMAGGVVQLDAERSAGVLQEMTPAEREGVMGDVLDGIVGSIALKKLR